MTKFDEQLFEKSDDYLFYSGKFVARFKYSRGDLSGFKTFLIKNFTIEEYFDQLNSDLAPVTILESKGYVGSKIKKMLKSLGYEPTLEGKKAYLEKSHEQFSAFLEGKKAYLEKSHEQFAASYYAGQVTQALSSL